MTAYKFPTNLGMLEIPVAALSQEEMGSCNRVALALLAQLVTITDTPEPPAIVPEPIKTELPPTVQTFPQETMPGVWQDVDGVVWDADKHKHDREVDGDGRFVALPPPPPLTPARIAKAEGSVPPPPPRVKKSKVDGPLKTWQETVLLVIEHSNPSGLFDGVWQNAVVKRVMDEAKTKFGYTMGPDVSVGVQDTPEEALVAIKTALTTYVETRDLNAALTHVMS